MMDNVNKSPRNCEGIYHYSLTLCWHYADVHIRAGGYVRTTCDGLFTVILHARKKVKITHPYLAIRASY